MRVVYGGLLKLPSESHSPSVEVAGLVQLNPTGHQPVHEPDSHLQAKFLPYDATVQSTCYFHRHEVWCSQSLALTCPRPGEFPSLL